MQQIQVLTHTDAAKIIAKIQGELEKQGKGAEMMMCDNAWVEAIEKFSIGIAPFEDGNPT